MLSYICAFLLGHIAGALLGSAVGSMFGTVTNGMVTKGGYLFRWVRGAIYGSATIINAIAVLSWFDKSAPPSFQLVLVCSFFLLTILNQLKLAAAIARYRGSAVVHATLSDLARPRLAQDLAAGIGAIVTLIIVHIAFV